jgi:hypothetical protein
VLATTLTLLLGVWLVVAPALLDYEPGVTGRLARWNDVVVGTVVALLSLVHAAAPAALHRVSWVNAAAGAWLVAATVAGAVVGRAGSPAVVNDVLVGALILLSATGAALAGAESRRETQRHARG